MKVEDWKVTFTAILLRNKVVHSVLWYLLLDVCITALMANNFPVPYILPKKQLTEHNK